jgi:fermentation-respiration switch protein FrsA (DUF1100 family)
MFAAVAADRTITSIRDQAREAVLGFYLMLSFPFVSLAVLDCKYISRRRSGISPGIRHRRIEPVPVFIIAGEGDEMIPAENGRRLSRAAKEPKKL